MRRHAPPVPQRGTEPVTASAAPPAQRAAVSERAAPLGHDISRVPLAAPIQRQAAPGAAAGGAPLPNRLRAGIEQLSGYDMSDVRVHHNSPKPARVDALAYAQGRDIHLAAGQEKHLPHEAWHVVQQKQGRVKSTTQVKGFPVNDDKDLEQEANSPKTTFHQLDEMMENRNTSTIQRVKIGNKNYDSAEDLFRYMKGTSFSRESTRTKSMYKTMAADKGAYVSKEDFEKAYPEVFDENIMYGGGEYAATGALEGSDTEGEFEEDLTKHFGRQREINVRKHRGYTGRDIDKNVLSASVMITYRRKDSGADKSVYSTVQKMLPLSLNSETNEDTESYFNQHGGLGISTNSAKKGYTQTAHGHSEPQAAMKSTEITQQITQAHDELIEEIPNDSTIVNSLVNFDSYPNAMCMNGCRYAIGTVTYAAIKKNSAEIRAAADETDGESPRYSSKYSSEMTVSSGRMFKESQNPKLKERSINDKESGFRKDSANFKLYELRPDSFGYADSDDRIQEIETRKKHVNKLVRENNKRKREQEKVPDGEDDQEKKKAKLK